MATIKIESLGREIELLPYTHKIAKAEKLALLKWVNIGTGQDITTGGVPNIVIPVTNQIESEEVKMLWVTGLTADELGSVTEEEYNAILEAVNDHINTKKK